MLYKLGGAEARYADVEVEESRGTSKIAADEFYGQPLATAVRKILTMRRQGGNGPATVAEIYEMLVRGGFLFETKNEDYAKRGLRGSLTKNTIFHLLPGK